MKGNSVTLEQYLANLAKNTPTPGGGSASAVVASIACSLAEMVCGTLLKRSLPAKERARLKKSLIVLRVTRKKIQRVISEDAQVYQKVRKAYALPKTDRDREKEIDRQLQASFAIMADLCQVICKVRRAITSLDQHKKTAIYNDAYLSAIYLQASCRGAFATARINVESVIDTEKGIKLDEKLKTLKAEIKSAGMSV